MTEEQTEYKTPDLKGVLEKARKVMLRNALLKVKDGKTLTAKETELIEEAEAETKRKDRQAGAFTNLLGVVAHLQTQGWKVGQATVYKHHKEGKLRPDAEGFFDAPAVEKYAIQWLRKRSDAEHVKAEKLLEQERKEKIRYTTAIRKKMELQLAILQGKYVAKDQLYLELASRAAVLDSGIRATVQLRAEEWMSACRGDQGCGAEFIRAVLQDMEDLVNSFSTTKTFQVMFQRPEVGGQKSEEERVSHTESTENAKN